MRYTTTIRFHEDRTFSDRCLASSHDSIHTAIVLAEWGMENGATYVKIRTADGEMVSGTAQEEWLENGELTDCSGTLIDLACLTTS